MEFVNMRKLLSVPLLVHLSGIGVISSFSPQSMESMGVHRTSLSTARKSLNRHLEDKEEAQSNRRDFFIQVTGSSMMSLLAGFTFPAPPVHARGLVSFPCKTPLLNVYHLMRAGTSLLEEEDLWSTNPLFLTNREAALSEKGKEEAQAAADVLKAADINPSVIKYSLAASAVDSAMVIRDELKVGQNRLIPEFTFMDPRAIGKWDMLSIAETFPAVVAMDEQEAGKDGKGALPPANTDGTPQDTLADQAIRLRQLMSVLETQFSGDNIVLVFPDGSSPALLTAMIAGIPYNKAHVLEFAPGEIRLDVTMAATLQLYKKKLQENSKEYNTLIEHGKVELKRLRSMNDEDIVSKKDLLIEEERVAMEKEYQQREEARMAKEELEQQARLARLKELESTRLRSRGILGDERLPFDKMDEPSIPPLFIGGAFAAYTVLTLSSAGQNSKNDPRRSNVTIISPIASSASLNFAEGINTTSARSGPMASEDMSLFADMVDNYQITGTNINGDAPPKDTRRKSETERNDDARKAMQDYMAADDGGDAWLQAMSSIIEEDDEDDPFISDDEIS